MAALLALCASLSWGTSDFAGGTMARRLHPLAVAGVGQALVLPVVAAVVVALGAPANPSGWLVWGVVAGVTGALALGCFFQALATGTMGVVAPIAATGVAVPVVIGLVQGERPAAAQLAGIAVAIAGIVLASGPELRSARRGDAPGSGLRPLAFALAAAGGFGIVLWSVARGSHDSVGMTLLASRVAEVAVVGLVAGVTRRTGGVGRRDLVPLALISTGDVVASTLYGFASRRGLVVIVAVLASLYPVVTALLARIVHGERLQRLQVAGVAVALCGVVLITAG